MALNYKDDLFMLQVRLFRLAQIRWDKNPKECEAIFNKYDINSYIETCYEEYHVQGDDANFDDIENYLTNKGWTLCRQKVNVSKYDYTMQLLAAMASINLARQQKISRTKAFFKFMNSKTGEMLFDESTDMWMNGPDYIADEYRREMLGKRKHRSTT